MKGSAAAAALLTRSRSRVHGAARVAVTAAKSPLGSKHHLLMAPCRTSDVIVGTSAVSRSYAMMSSLVSTAQSQPSIVRTAAAASKSRSLLADLHHPRYPQQQQQLYNHYHHHQQQQWRHLVMITKTKAGDIKVDDADVAVVVDTAIATLDMTSNITPKPPRFQPDEETHELLNITDACWNKIEQLAAAKKQKDLYLRLVIDAGGCSGFSYKFEFDTDENLVPDDDVVFTRPQRPNTGNDDDNNHSSTTISNEPNVYYYAPRVVVDAGSLEFIQGSTIDYVQEMIKSSFQVRDNPQSESACGCGSSFAVKNFSANPALD